MKRWTGKYRYKIGMNEGVYVYTDYNTRHNYNYII